VNEWAMGGRCSLSNKQAMDYFALLPHSMRHDNNYFQFVQNLKSPSLQAKKPRMRPLGMPLNA
jgi:hypothetical protein